MKDLGCVWSANGGVRASKTKSHINSNRCALYLFIVFLLFVIANTIKIYFKDTLFLKHIIVIFLFG